MITLDVYLAAGLTSNTVSAIAESTIGSMKTTDFRKMGVDSVNLKYLTTDEEKANFARNHGSKIPTFVLSNDGRKLASMQGYESYNTFSHWLKTHVTR